MRTIVFYATVIVVFAFSGCLRSLYPLYTEKDLVFDKKLLGTWVNEEGEKETWTFQKNGEKSYELIQTSKGSPARFEVHLVKLGEYKFLDIYPAEPDTKNDLYKLHIIPAHTFSRVWLTNTKLGISFFDNDWMKDMIEQGNINIEHNKIDNSIILSAPTKDLQRLVLQYAEDTRAFPKPSQLVRR